MRLTISTFKNSLNIRKNIFPAGFRQIDQIAIRKILELNFGTDLNLELDNTNFLKPTRRVLRQSGTEFGVF